MFASLFLSKYRLHAGIALLVCSLFIGTFQYGKHIGVSATELLCETTKQQEQLRSQNENIQLMQKAKTISRRNNNLERDQLINKL